MTHRLPRLVLILLLLVVAVVPGCGSDPSTSASEPGVIPDSVIATQGPATTPTESTDVEESSTPSEAVSSTEPDVQAAATDTLTSASQDSATTRRVGDMTLNEAGEAVQDYGMRVFWAIVLFILTYLFNKGVVWLLERLSERSAERRLFYKRLVPLARVIIWSIALYFVIRVVFKVDAQNLLAATAALGVAVGFAAQDLLKNIFGGLVIISDRPFQVGDKISVAGTYGEVKSIGLRSTRIVTPDDNLVTVPNAQVVDTQVANANAGALDCQVVTDLYLPGWIDERKAKALAYEAAASSKFVYRNKPIVVIVKDEFKETFLTHLKVKAYVFDTRYEFLLMSDITERCREAFREAGLLSREDGMAVMKRGGGPPSPRTEAALTGGGADA